MIKTILLTAIGASALATFSSAAVTTLTPTLDTDSYIFVGTENDDDEFISVGERYTIVGSHHYTVGHIEFNVSGLAIDENKTLTLTPYEFKTGTGPGGERSFTGSTKVKLVALDAPWSDYTGSFFKGSWVDTHVNNVTEIGIFEFSNDDPNKTELDPVTLDVTATVNSWINGDKPNYGFALVCESQPRIELYSSDHEDGATKGPLLKSFPAPVPEPSSAALLGAGGLALLLRRRR